MVASSPSSSPPPLPLLVAFLVCCNATRECVCVCETVRTSTAHVDSPPGLPASSTRRDIIFRTFLSLLLASFTNSNFNLFFFNTDVGCLFGLHEKSSSSFTHLVKQSTALNFLMNGEILVHGLDRECRGGHSLYCYTGQQEKIRPLFMLYRLAKSQ